LNKCNRGVFTIPDDNIIIYSSSDDPSSDIDSSSIIDPSSSIDPSSDVDPSPSGSKSYGFAFLVFISLILLF